MPKEDILNRLADTVLKGDTEGCRKAAEEAVAAKIPAYTAIMEGWLQRN